MSWSVGGEERGEGEIESVSTVDGRQTVDAEKEAQNMLFGKISFFGLKALMSAKKVVKRTSILLW